MTGRKTKPAKPFLWESIDHASGSRGDRAYRELWDAIQDGTLKPGTRLREVELAKWLGSSRTPIREALVRLQSGGMVIRDPHRGMIIAELDHSMVSELYVMREVLEGTAAGLAARHASDVEIATLREIADQDREIGYEPVRLAKNNRLLHEALYRSAHNRYLIKMLRSLRESLALLGETTLAVTGRPESSIAEHEAIISSIEHHDPLAAEETARSHIRASYRIRLRLLLFEGRGKAIELPRQLALGDEESP